MNIFIRQVTLLPILSLILLCFHSVSLGKEVHMDDLIERDGLWYEKFTITPFTGSVYTDYILKYADDVIFWIVLPDGVIWIEFLKQINLRHLLTPASQRIGWPMA